MSDTNGSTGEDAKKYAPPNAASNPPKKEWRHHFENSNTTLPVPWWFNALSVAKFHDLPLHSSDVFISSGVKMGTTWMNKIVISLLHEYDNNGQLIDEAIQSRPNLPGRLGQTYPEGIYPTQSDHDADPLHLFDRIPNGRMIHSNIFGNFVLDDIVNQPQPRIFTTHLFGKGMLPKELFDTNDNSQKGKGKFIIVLRNLKDSMCSLHNFRGLPYDDWHGNQHGPGTYARYLMSNKDTPNAFGSAFEWIKVNNEVIQSIGHERSLVVYYESLILDFDNQLRRINNFLELGELSDVKANAIKDACALQSMQSAGARYSYTTRKGGIGKWSQHEVAPLSTEQWKEFDRVFNVVLNDVEIAEPLRFFQYESVPGLPERTLDECDLETDYRSWSPYLLVMLRDGMIVPDPYYRLNHGTKTSHLEGGGRDGMTEFKYNKPDLSFDESNSDGSPRYHLFVSELCPLSSSVSATRTLIGLERVISMDVADGESGAGLVFMNGCSCAPWKGNNSENGGAPFWLYSVYQLSDPSVTTRITAPVLWDTVTQRIVSNDAWEILRLMSIFAEQQSVLIYNDVLGVIPIEGLCPAGEMELIESVYSDLSSSIFNIETLGNDILSGRADAADIYHAVQRMSDKLKELDGLLGDKRFLMGANLTGVDVVLAMFLFRFDACYIPLFGLADLGPILTGDAYPNLKAYAREMYREVKSTLKAQSFRQISRLANAIAFTREAYATTAGEVHKPTIGNHLLPDLNKILALLEEPSGDRPGVGMKRVQSAPQIAVPQIIRDGIVLPFWFRDDTFKLYRDLDLRDDDIILSSGVKMGTTWVTKILNSLLYDFDDEGKHTSNYMNDAFPNRLGQTYPEALFPSREVEEHEMATKDEAFVKKMKMLKQNFGDFVFDDLLNQPSPRLFSSHLSGNNMLPKRLFDGWKDEDHDDGDCAINGEVRNGDAVHTKNKGRGKLIVVTRNLKDTLVSLHHFRGVPKDGWLGNEHGPGSFERAIDLETCPNAFGNTFLWIKRSGESVEAIGPRRALVLRYEDLKLDFASQLERINDFLGLPKLTEAKAKAVAIECAAKSMKQKAGGRFKLTIRKGVVGDWQNYLDEERWTKFDEVFDHVLGGLDIAEPLRRYQCKEGLDEILAAQEES